METQEEISMFRRRWIPVTVLLVQAFVFGLAAAGGPQQEESPTGPKALEFKESVIAGGPDDFLEVKHLVLSGSNFEIGKKLGRIAYQQLGTGPLPFPDIRRTRTQLSYFKKYYPLYIERMRGMAAAFGMTIDNHALNFSALLYGFPLAGCSVVFYPPAAMANGRGVLSRNFDFTTGSMLGKVLGPEEQPACARPFVIEMYPDKGYASLAICCFDLLGGVLDGINSEGLCVAILADEELIQKYDRDPFFGFQPGFSELQILRYVLDTCADVEEAKEAFLEAKLYYSFAPNHYIIADAAGNSFIWENTGQMHYGHIIEGDGKPQITTNFSLHLHPDLENIDKVCDRFPRLRTLCEERHDKFDIDFIKSASGQVAFCKDYGIEGYASPRTIWHALYFPSECRMEVDFYLGDEEDPESPDKIKIRRSGYRSFALDLALK
jgi:hypothetical protein